MPDRRISPTTVTPATACAEVVAPVAEVAVIEIGPPAAVGVATTGANSELIAAAHSGLTAQAFNDEGTGSGAQISA